MPGRTIRQLKSDERTIQEQQQEFLAAFLEMPIVTKAARRVKVARANIYHWAKSDPDFKQRFDDAAELAALAIEDEATRRAYEGCDKPVYQKGQCVGHIREYSDTLMMLILKAKLPEKYRERTSTEISGPGGKPIPVSPLDGLTFDELMQLKYGKDYNKEQSESGEEQEG